MSVETGGEWSDIRGSIGAADVAASEEDPEITEKALLDALSKVRRKKADYARGGGDGE